MEKAYETVCEIPRGSKAFKWQLVIDYNSGVCEKALEQYVRDEISFRRFKKLKKRHEKESVKAWGKLREFAKLDTDAEMRLNRAEGNVVLQTVRRY
ncbi:MAG: hypothetical protein GY820_39115 [Gammaproteobacteria bacterium]|nr:hypothetical protein [Gammaproteobacteria bacterium]